MILYKRSKDILQHILLSKEQGKTIGFVPTMGALHDGHLSLIKASQQQNNITVCSIFVNPTQFNDISDYNKYPVTIEKDILLLTERNASLLFLPSVDDIYPNGINHLEHYPLGEIETRLEGEFRPGHFQGVCGVVHRLFSVVQPHRSYFGQKDYQQCMVIKKMIELTQSPVEMVIHPTIREENGLAMSSRNLRLSAEDKTKATAIYTVLNFIKNNCKLVDIEPLRQEATKLLLDVGFSKIDYIEIADAETLAPISHYSEDKPAVALIAAFLNGVRLIDNMVL